MFVVDANPEKHSTPCIFCNDSGPILFKEPPTYSDSLFTVQGADCLRVEHRERRAGLGVIQRARVCAAQSPRFTLDYLCSLYAIEEIVCCLRLDCVAPYFIDFLFHSGMVIGQISSLYLDVS